MRFELDGQIAELRERHPLLREGPGSLDTRILEGRLNFVISDGPFEGEEGDFLIRLEVPVRYPEAIPRVFELGGLVPAGFHRYTDDSLCLASPIDLDLFMLKVPSLATFVDEVVVSYFLNFLIGEKTGKLPFGERGHNLDGLIESLADWLKCHRDVASVAGLLDFLAGVQPFHRSKACPCGSERPLRECHFAHLHNLRRTLGKNTLASLAKKQRLKLLPWLVPQLNEPSSVKKWRDFMQRLCSQVGRELDTSTRTG